MTVTIYHNPRCSKSRQTLQLLKEHAIEPEVIEYLKTPVDKNTIKSLLKLLGLSPRELMRHNEAAYKELKLADASLSDEALMDALLEHPILLQRPIVVANGKARIGRPPEAVLEILADD